MASFGRVVSSRISKSRSRRRWYSRGAAGCQAEALWRTNHADPRTRDSNGRPRHSKTRPHFFSPSAPLGRSSRLCFRGPRPWMPIPVPFSTSAPHGTPFPFRFRRPRRADVRPPLLFAIRAARTAVPVLFSWSASRVLPSPVCFRRPRQADARCGFFLAVRVPGWPSRFPFRRPCRADGRYEFGMAISVTWTVVQAFVPS